MPTRAKEKFRTYHGVFDEFTNRTIFKLITEGHFDGIIGPLSTGKEAMVFQAKKGNSKVAVKVYRLENCDFNRMYDYIKYDPRFLDLKKQKRKVIFAWCQREYRNLLKAREASVKAPIPITFQNNILVMEFIGGEDAAPKLKDRIPKDNKEFFKKITTGIKNLYKADMVHTDLSSFNILNHEETPVIIDWSQATSLKNPNSKGYLARDIKNICNFFRRQGLKIEEEKILDEATR